ncbi:MAG: AMP-binding protein, partial [Verrucomicrobiae bacterium]|nr:AMP-binding protein [Verrucomicrobiae bacterium]
QRESRLEITEKVLTSQTLCNRFDQVVKRFPNNLAVKTPSSALTYAELDSLANGLARHLRRPGLDVSDRVGILLSSGELSVLTEVGGLKAGLTLVYLNVSFPLQRLKEMVEASKIRLLVTQSAHLSVAHRLIEDESRIINLEEPGFLSPGENPQMEILPETPTAIGFSSGSTGAPKLMIRDQTNDLHFIYRVSESIGLDSRDRILFTMGSLLMPFLALAHGGCYFPANLQHDGDLTALINWIKQEKITVLRAPVSTFRALCWSLRDTDEFPDLRLIVLQGEPVYKADVAAYQDRFPESCVLVSSLGVSEFGDFCHFFVDASTRLNTPTVPGGYPLEGIEVVLKNKPDANESAEGEIGIRGKFMSNATSQQIGGDTYYTGDLAKVDPDGCVYHLGRTDFQVKVRGNRVDLLAIESVLLDRDRVSGAAVVGDADANGNTRLIAFIEPDSVDTASIREALKETLPGYMIPERIVCLEKLPRTLTGKIDRKSLPASIRIQSPAGAAKSGADQTLPET